MIDFQFAQAQWVHAIWAVLAIIAILLFLEFRANHMLDRFLDRSMQKNLVARSSLSRRLIRISLLGLCGIFLVMALMRPQWGTEFIETPLASAELMVCLDVSKSMLAEDVVPNRLDRAKAEIRDLLPYLKGDQVGLIAFAGSATVSCPMTPDFSFLRYVLDETGIHSTSLGGTQLSEPIEKAMAAFQGPKESARVIVIITDGEDHDSYPVEAAKRAAEKGIQIVSIGIGSESGTKITYTDPVSKKSVTVKDSNDEVVLSRLDGATLQEMAEVTNGYYIPAGTNNLDLESIYNDHLAGLMRGNLTGRNHQVRKEAYQWAILAAMISLFFAAAFSGGAKLAKPAAPALAALLLLISSTSIQPCLAQSTQPAAQEEAEEASADEEIKAQLEIPEDAREAFKASLDLLVGESLEEAKRFLEAARSGAKGDYALTHSAIYNLGWAYAKEGDAAREAKPEEALEAYRNAKGYFAEALQLQAGKDEDARHNLQVVALQIKALEDELRPKDKDLKGQLDELIKDQRKLTSLLRPLVEFVTQQSDVDSIQELKGRFKEDAKAQRKLLSTSGSCMDNVEAERATLAAKKPEELEAKESERLFQLTQVKAYIHKARQRMGQTRRQLRLKNAERAFRRSSATLAELKRARDQLRQPVEILQAILKDQTQLGQNNYRLILASKPNADQKAPSWISQEHLTDQQLSVVERHDEIHQRLKFGLENYDKQKLETPGNPQAPTDPQAATKKAEEEKYIANLNEAMPYLDSAQIALTAAHTSLEAKDLNQGLVHQSEALVALQQAIELFLDIKGLVETIYHSEAAIDQLMKTLDGMEEQSANELGAGLVQAQQKNTARSERLAKLIQEELAKLPEPKVKDPNSQQATDPEEQKAAQRRQLLNHANILLEQCQGGFAKLESAFASEPLAMADMKLHMPPTLEDLSELRRLFFTLIEHLKDSARRQSNIGDETESAITLQAQDELAAKLDEINHDQIQNQALATEIAKTLEQQAAQGAQGAQGNPQQSQQAMQQADQYRRAGELVNAATGEMQQAIALISKSEEAQGAPNQSANPDPNQALSQDQKESLRNHQNNAYEQLLKAIAVLEPPQRDQQPDQQQQPEDQNDEKKQQEKDPDQQMQQALQREAKRRKDKQERNKDAHRAGNTAVEKDW